MAFNNPFEKFLGGGGTIVSADAENKDVPITREEKRVKGKIIKVSEEGWGFISSKDIKFTRIFFHWTSLKQDTMNFTQLKNGLKVEFTPVEVEGKGWRAIKISVLDEPKDDETSK